MIKNYFKTALRSLTRNINYTIINVAGLAVGIAVCLVIFLIIRFQTSFDNFHAKKDHIYRVLTEYHDGGTGNISYGKNVPFPMPAGLKTNFPQSEQVATVYASHNDELQVLDANGTPVKNFKEKSGVFYTEPSFFNIFNFPLLAGSYASLKDPGNVLLT
ncbi:MAG: ABC transporter permease, partial [Bacteroidota bacterium]